ncbi:hypothetical protein HMPREF0063_12372 [Aeromicrobium marinum DSM 15272]|uniref:Uncharacterized protein n=1 Tax=Aeromicrobium marinum DSM 15272 TaxID=585531 RepID=E2SD60_9ACTN|nr:circularly permuted type 2 ATP-grasp protein [Aeromicrobium marinum]EFQ83163.1 hypothetical protein HMPREF0063_12372 [Aeromicrobium marinum DSM 15272]
MTVLRDYTAAVTQPTLADEPARYDEVVAPDGALRPAWRGLAASAIDLTETELRRVGRDIDRFLGDDGVRYSRPGEPSSPWLLDPLPLVVTAEEWAPLEVGLAQRAELLNAVLVDLYGPQRLLTSGVVPPAVVFGHSGFLRVMARVSAAESHPLLVTATDVARTATGGWQVLADRAQAPSGIGYAMENRRVISRVVPELYRDAGLHRMAPYFQALRSTLMDSAPGDVPDPRVVVLTPGSQSETAYDQAFVASSLGFPLVQGSDLVVRDGAVWLRVYGRLERVHVVLRRVDAAWSDPLELRGDSQLGVAGLVEAVRRGTVRVVNGLGAGVLENPALLPFMASMCEALLDEPLRLPSVPTRWLGEPEHLAWVRDHLADVTIRTIDRTPGLHDLGPSELLARVEREPHRYVATEAPVLSQAPVLGATGAGIVPGPVQVRTFTIRYGSSYRPLMGGLGSVVDGSRFASSKDVWVLKERPDEPDQRLTEVLPMTNVRAPAAMVPRVLEDMFWFGRYAERAEDTLRLVLAAHGAADDFRSRPHSSGAAALRVLIGALEQLSASPFDDGVLDENFRSLLLDPHRPASVAQSVSALRDTAQAVRDQLSPDVWRVFGSIDRSARSLQEVPYGYQVSESAGRMLTAASALHGVTANMVRDEGWRMIGVGRAVERSLQLSRLLRATVTTRRGIDVDRDVHQAVLTVAESAVTHRRRYRGYVRLASVLDLLVCDPDNPRSLSFNLEEVGVHLAHLPASTGSTRPERLVADLADEVARVEVAALVAIEGERRPNLEAFLDAVVLQLSRFADSVADLHLASAPAPRSFGLLGGGGGR